MGNRLGLDPAVLSQIINAASGRCWSSDTYNPVPGVIETVPSSNGYKGGFGTTLMTKVCSKFQAIMDHNLWCLTLSFLQKFHL